MGNDTLPDIGLIFFPPFLFFFFKRILETDLSTRAEKEKREDNLEENVPLFPVINRISNDIEK